MTARFRRGAVSFALILLGLVLGLAFVELGMRAAGALLSWRARPEASAGGARFTILCLGESTTAPSVSSDDISWPRQLQRLLDAQPREPSVRVVNKGISGTNSALILARLPGYLDAFKPDLVITMIGVNDSRWFGIVQPASPLYRLKVVTLARYLYHELRRRFAPPALSFPPALASSSIDELARGGASRPSPSGALARCAKLRWSHGFMIERRPDVLAEARETCLRASRESPLSPLPFEALGYAAQAEGRLSDAGVAYETAIRLGSEDPLAFPTLAKALERRGDLSGAESALLLHVHQDPRQDPAYLILAQFYLDHGRPQDALATYREAAQTDPDARWPLVAGLGPSDGEGKLNAVTTANYRRIRDLVLARGIPMIAMQYPTLDVQPLKTTLGNRPGVLFVSNRENFARALARGRYADYFWDRFGGAWGHTTLLGSTLIARRLLVPARQALAARGGP